jgi:hypothetical protein
MIRVTRELFLTELIADLRNADNNILATIFNEMNLGDREANYNAADQTFQIFIEEEEDDDDDYFEDETLDYDDPYWDDDEEEEEDYDEEEDAVTSNNLTGFSDSQTGFAD